MTPLRQKIRSARLWMVKTLMQAVALPSSVNAHARPPGRVGWLLLAPLLAWLAAFVIVPMLILFVYSFCSRDDLGRVVFSFTLENYERVFDPTYLKILGRSVGYAALTTLICVVIGYPVAWFMARQRESVRHKLLLLVMIPFWTSFLIRTYAWIAILKERGPAERLAPVGARDRGAARSSLHADGGRHRTGLRVSAVHDSADLRQRGETRQRARRGRLRSRGGADPRVFRGHHPAHVAGEFRRASCSCSCRPSGCLRSPI